MWQLDPTSPIPLYQQIITLIENALERGQLAPGDRLPAERQLSQLLGVNRSTVIHALDQLSDRGLLLRRRGAGTYINPQKWGVQPSPLIHLQRGSRFACHQPPDLYQWKAAQLRRQGKGVRDLANGDLPTDLLPALTLPTTDWQSLLEQEQREIASPLGLLSLRRAVQTHLRQRCALDVDLAQILITSGIQQALFLISQGLLKAGDAIGVDAPSYFYSLPLFQASGLRLCALPVDEQGIRPEGLERCCRQHNLRMIFLNPVFQNPVGYVMSPPRKQQLLKFCQARQIPIVEDDTYSALSFDASLNTSPLKCADRRDQVIYLGSLSKYMGRNLRIGWLIAPPAIVAQMATLRQHLDAGLSLFPQYLAGQYLNDCCEQHLIQLRRALAERATQLMRWLTQHYGETLHYTPPRGGFHLWAQLTDADPAKLNAVLDQLLAQGVIVARGQEFGSTPYHLRFSFGHFQPFGEQTPIARPDDVATLTRR